MKYIRFSNGYKIPAIGLGTYQQNVSSIKDILYAAVDAGYRLIDTATVYKNQKSIGEFIRESNINRQELFLTSKVWNDEHDNVSSSLQRTLEELQTDYLDLFLIHWPAMQEGNFVKAWEGLIRLRDEGLIRSIGVSNFSLRQICHLQNTTGELPVINQVEIHLRHQQKKLVRDLLALGIMVQSWSPLWTGELTDEETSTLDLMVREHGKSIAQLTLAWHVSNNLCSVPKTSRAARLAENINIFNIVFSDEEKIFLSSLNRDMKIMEYPDDYV
ncbi:aldo/keto reductase [Salmonella enterica]|nr:aldo/keto reductase [Salmonella enterica]EHZ1642026.1 aldo/keto reductase [Salmonella enterica]